MKRTRAEPDTAATSAEIDAADQSSAASEQSDSGCVDRSDWQQLTFRAPPKAKAFLEVFCAKRGVTTQSLGLQWLRSLGAPVSDTDLNDNRKKKSKKLHARVDASPTTKNAGGNNKGTKRRAREGQYGATCLTGLTKSLSDHRGRQPAPAVQVVVVNIVSGGRSLKPK
jgi:hypothetical protein